MGSTILNRGVSILLSCALLLSFGFAWLQPVLLAYAADDRPIVKVGYVETRHFSEGASEDAEKSGIAYEYLQRVSYQTNWKYEYVYGSWNEILDKLKTGEVDIVADVSKTSDRESQMQFPEYPMGFENYYIYTRADGPLRTAMPDDLNGCTVGVNAGTRMETALQDWNSKGSHGVTIVPYYNNEARIADFEAGAIDAMATTDYEVSADDKAVPVARVGGDDYYLAVSNQRPDLFKQLSQALDNIESIDPGFTREITAKYYSETAISARITPAEAQWVNEHPVIRIGYFDDYLPFSDTDDQGNATGIITDVMDEIIRSLNLEGKLQVTFVPYSEESKMLDALKNGEVDVISPVEEDVALAEQRGLYLTNPLITTTMNFVFKNQVDMDGNIRIAVTRGNEIQYAYAASGFPHAQIVTFDSVDQSLDAVMSGAADAILLNEYRLSGYLNNTRFSSLNYIQLPDPSTRCMAVEAGNSELLSILDRGITSLPNNFLTTATYKYAGRLASYTVSDFMRDNMALFVLMTLVPVVVIVFGGTYMYQNRRRRHQLDVMAHRDAMTDLFNRRAFNEDYDALMKDGFGSDFVFLTVDLNQLKYVNDTFGHDAGDSIIVGAATCLKETVGKYGSVYRTGGDEYVAMLRVEPGRLQDVLQELTDAIDAWRDGDLRLSASIGCVAAADEPEMSLRDMRRQAELRMYEMKQAFYESNGNERRRN